MKNKNVIFCILFKNWRFNRDIHNVIHPFSMVLCKYNQNKKNYIPNGIQFFKRGAYYDSKWNLIYEGTFKNNLRQCLGRLRTNEVEKY